MTEKAPHSPLVMLLIATYLAGTHATCCPAQCSHFVEKQSHPLPAPWCRNLRAGTSFLSRRVEVSRLVSLTVAHSVATVNGLPPRSAGVTTHGHPWPFTRCLICGNPTLHAPALFRCE